MRVIHRIPNFEGEKWSRLAKIIANSPYELPIILEVNISVDTKEQEMIKLDTARKNGEKFTKMINKYRRQ